MSWSVRRSSWVTHIAGVEGGRMRLSIMEQGGNMSVGGGGSGGGSTRAWSRIVGSVGMGTSGRVSSNFITGEGVQGTSSEGVIIGDIKEEIDRGSERGRVRGVAERLR